MYTDITTLPRGWIIIFVVLAIWELVWKGMALWRSAQRGDTAWFVILFIINTIGILPIIYLLLTKKKIAH